MKNKQQDNLFKYCKFNTNTLHAILSGEVYFSSASSFNDPLDSKPSIEIDINLSDMESLFFSMTKEVSDKNHALNELNRLKNDALEFDGREGGEYHKELLRSNIEEILLAEFGKCGILSLTKHWNCSLMWSHYGDQHRGICLEYDINTSSFDNLEPINYSSSRIIKMSELFDWKIKDSSDVKNAIFRKVFFGKAPQWRYEKEWRAVVQKTGLASAPANISAIYFGCRCVDILPPAMVKLYKTAEHKIKFYSIFLEKDGYKLKRKIINQDELMASIPRSSAHMDFFNDISNEISTRKPFWLR